jgi:hypothetical protein
VPVTVARPGCQVTEVVCMVSGLAGADGVAHGRAHFVAHERPHVVSDVGA